jgi:AraC-like DNA-binding protein
MEHDGSRLAAICFPPESRLFSSADPQHVQRDVARVFKPHRLRLRGSDRGLRAQMSTIRQGRFSVSRLEYGATVEIDPGPLDDFFLVQIPVSGLADIACGSSRFESSPRAASFVSPTLPLRMRWFAGNAQICVRFERDFVEQHGAAHLGHTPDAPLAFDPRLSLETVAGRYFLRLLEIFIDEVSVAHGAGAQTHPLRADHVGDQFASSLLNALLYGQPHTWSDALHQPARAAAPHFVRRAEDYMRAHYREPVTVEALAVIAGVSTRTLFAGFRDFRETTPMAHLKELRLEKARQALLAGQAADAAQVTSVALDCGFSHLGRFAASYRERFGETPSTTARFRRR